VVSDHDAHRRFTWDAQCRAASSGLTCALIDSEGRDQTASAVWTVTGPATVTAPGQVQTTAYGEVFVSAGYADAFGRFEVRAFNHFLADPPRAARRFHFLGGLVRESSGDQVIPDARVTILDGYNVGRGGATESNGHYTIDPVLTGEDFTVRAEKTGYEPLTRTYRVDDPVSSGAPGNSPFLDLRLARLPG